jgi:hypothetical protein
VSMTSRSRTTDSMGDHRHRRNFTRAPGIGSLMSLDMSNRHLALAAAIVWAIAVLVGVFIAAPLWFGFDVDAGLIANALVALGTFAAAAAAVWVATTDRRERTQERGAQRLAQAMLVLVDVRVPAYRDFEIVVENCGGRAVLDVAVESATFAPQPDATVDVVSPTDARVSVLRSGQVQAFTLEVVDGQGYSVFGVTKDDHGNEHYEEDRDPADLSASVRFRDADGVWWTRSTSGDAVPLGPRPARWL